MTVLSPHPFVPAEDGSPGCVVCGRKEDVHPTKPKAAA